MHYHAWDHIQDAARAVRAQWSGTGQVGLILGTGLGALAREIQAVAFEEVPSLPCGQYFPLTAYRRTLSDVPQGLPLFWGLRKA